MRQLPRPGRIGWIHPDQPRGIPVWEWGTARRTVISGLCGPLVAPFTASSSLRSRIGGEQAAIRPVFTRGALPAPATSKGPLPGASKRSPAAPMDLFLVGPQSSGWRVSVPIRLPKRPSNRISPGDCDAP